MRGALKKISVVSVLLLLCFIVNWTQRTMDRYRSIKFVDKRVIFLPKGEVLKYLSMGYRGLMGDWLWIRSVLYYGRRVVDEDNPYYQYALKKGEREEPLVSVSSQVSAAADTLLQIREELKHILYKAESRGLVDYIYPMLDRVTSVDPHFVFPYIFGGLYVLMDTGEVDQAQKLLEKGYRANPDRWEFPFYLGWIHWMYREDLEKTVKYLLEAVKKKECPSYVGNLLAGLSMKLGYKESTLLYLKTMINSTDNPEIRKQLEEVLEKISKNR